MRNGLQKKKHVVFGLVRYGIPLWYQKKNAVFYHFRAADRPGRVQMFVFFEIFFVILTKQCVTTYIVITLQCALQLCN
jgi:hypothetical protein